MIRLVEPFPQTFGPFEVLELLGHGGMAAVYRARYKLTGREVALKVPHPGQWAKPEGKRRFREEARIGLSLSHPNACRILYFNDPAVDQPEYDEPAIVLPLMLGKSLEDRLDQPMRPLEAAHLALKLAEVLDDMHSQGFVHADLKPSNILFAKPGDDEPILADFGMTLDLNDPNATLPYPGQLQGSLAYMAPEQMTQLSGTLISPLFDVWAVGVLLYEMMTCQHPFLQDTVALNASKRRGFFQRVIRLIHADAETKPSATVPQSSFDLMNLIVAGQFVPVRDVNSRIPQRLADICTHALKTHIPDRFASASELADALREFIDANEVPDRSTRPVVPIESIHIDFVRFGTNAPDDLRDTLYLDVGGDIRTGVIDHHQLYHYPGSNATMVSHRLKWIDRCVLPLRKKYDRFTIVLHQEPDLDATVCAYLARYYLAHQKLPECTRVLCDYLDRVDTGHSGFSISQPFTVYTGYMALVARALTMQKLSEQERWRWTVENGFAMLDAVVAQSPETLLELLAIDVFNVNEVFTPKDRMYVATDRDRYELKLKDPKCKVRRTVLHLPRQSEGGREHFPALFARHVQDDHDPELCMFFKDWARSDRARTDPKPGFIALCIYVDIDQTWTAGTMAGRLGKAFLSVTPTSGVALRGLGHTIEQAEIEKRTRLFGHDTRDFGDKGERLPNREGYRSPDPWYDGRAHHFTMVAAPAKGSVLTADEIEAIFLKYGHSGVVHSV